MAFHVKRTLPGSASYALVSDAASADTAIVYVHGFLGDAGTTWEYLPYYVDRFSDEPLRDADLYFFDYAAENQSVQASVLALRIFLDQVFPTPPPELLRATLREIDWHLADDPDTVLLRQSRPYSRLILVGHSLGAVVVRRLVADEAVRHQGAARRNADVTLAPLLNAEVVLMAPAHLGFQLAGANALLKVLPFSLWGFRLAAVFRAFSDLQPGCHTLAQLQRETEKMAGVFPSAIALRPRALWGDREDVVLVGRFDSDPPPDGRSSAPGKDHVTVCKVTRDYRLPVDYMVRPKVAAGG